MSAVQEHRTFCRICPVLCGLVVSVDGDRVLSVRGDRDHPVSRGYTCPKGRALGEFHHHPQRLDHPLLRGEAVSWDALLGDLATTIAHVVEESGPDAVAVYFGTWSWMDALGRARAEELLRNLGSRSRYSAITIDAIARLTVAEMMGGLGALLPSIDTDDPGLTVLVGTNPVVSHGHAGAFVDPVVSLRRVAAGPGLWVVDPRVTQTSRLASRHLRPRPGSDPALLAHAVRELLIDGADDTYLAEHAVGLEELRAAVEPWALPRAAARTGLTTDGLTAFVAAIRSAGTVAVVTGTGCTMAAEANITEWLAWALQIVTGSFERPGGAWFNPGAFARSDRAAKRPLGGATHPGPPSRPDLPSLFGERPCAALADEIEVGNVRVLLVIGGNPVTSLPDTTRLVAAFGRLDALAVADVIAADTVRHATHVMPVAGQLEREDVTWFTDRFPPVITAQRTGPVVAPAGDRRTLMDVLDDLGPRIGLPPGPDPMSRYVARIPQLAVPGAFVAEPPRVKGWVHDRVLPDGKWRVAPAPLVAQLRDWGRAPAESLVVIPRRATRRMNSALRDIGRGGEDDELWVHPDDAATAGISEGATVAVTSTVGTIRCRARVTEDVLPGSVSIPHGIAGQNVSVLTDSRPGTTDALTGMVRQSGVRVTIEAAATQPDRPADGRTG
ncbi:MAG TPA: molybdopterin-dependent oxidoreductase [Acidimicrobiales bacterium]|nr:molybdopterin-dependent oxidoreductase [Acidimicrobiales bacterium]